MNLHLWVNRQCTVYICGHRFCNLIEISFIRASLFKPVKEEYKCKRQVCVCVCVCVIVKRGLCRESTLHEVCWSSIQFQRGSDIRGVGNGSRHSNARTHTHTHTHPQSSAYCKYYSVVPCRRTKKLNKSSVFASFSEKIFSFPCSKRTGTSDTNSSFMSIHNKGVTRTETWLFLSDVCVCVCVWVTPATTAQWALHTCTLALWFQ